MAVTLLPHQREVLNKLANGKVLVGGVGTGKTVVALAYFFEKVMGGTLGDLSSVKTPMDIYVFTTARKRDELDWQGWAARLGFGRDRNASVGGIQLTVDSYNNIGNYQDIKNAFFILDEQRMVGSGTWTRSFLKMAKNNQWIMLSATPGDRWEDYIPLFIANGFYRNRTQFKRDHIVYNTFSKFPKVDRYIGVGRLVKLRNSILVKMPYDRHTTRHVREIEVEYDKELFELVVKKRWHVYENRPLRDVSELFSVMRKVVNTDPSRLATLRTLLETHPRLIVFYNFDYELEILRSLTQAKIPVTGLDEKLCSSTTNGSTEQSNKESRPVSSTPSIVRTTPVDSVDMKTVSKDPFALAEWNGHKHQPVPTSSNWIYLVQYVAGAEAWNCTTTNSVIFYSLTYSYKNFEQAKGRIDRLDTPYSDLFYFVLMSKSAIDRAISRALKSKRSFNEKSFALNT